MTNDTNRCHALVYVSCIEMAYECISLLENPANASHVQHIASSLYSISLSLFPDTLASVFYDLVEAAEELGDTSTQECAASHLQHVKKLLREYSSASFINPQDNGDDKEVLHRYSLPILQQMTANPEDSPRLFVELVHTLDRLVTQESLTATAASKEILYTTDRPQIIAAPGLANSLQLSKELERPGDFRKNNPEDVWRNFVNSVPKRNMK